MDESNSTTIYIVRHGESEANVKKLVGGHLDSPLTKQGQEQAVLLGSLLKHVHFDDVFSSDLIRAKHTAELITLERNLALKTTQVLRERSYGQMEGTNQEALFALFEKWQVLSHEEQLKARASEDGESDEEVITRFITFIREIAVAYRGKTILIVTHGGVMHTFLIHIGYATYKTMKKVDNTAFIKVRSNGIEFEVLDTQGVHVEGK